MRRGFTLAEILIVLSITILLLGASFPIFTNLQSLRTTDAVKFEAIQSLRYAQAQAVAGVGNTASGFYGTGTSYTLYQGADYVSRVINQDQIINLPDDYSFAVPIDVNFQQKTGVPASAKVINIKHLDSTAAVININVEGLIY